MNALSRWARGIAKEFSGFIARGNVIDMAVGVVVGGAFTAIVNSLVGNIITPIIGLLVGGMDLSGFKLVIRPATAATSEVAIKYGVFIQQVLSFIIIAACVFALVKALGLVAARGGGMLAGMRGRVEDGAVDGSAVGDLTSDAETAQLLREIRDLLRAMADARDDGHTASALPVAQDTAPPSKTAQDMHNP